MNKVIKVFFATILCLTTLSACSKKPTTLDAFENMKVLYSGWDGAGKPTIDNTIDYAGNDETIQKLINNISYKVTPKKNLSNGDKVKVTLVYEDELADRANVQFKKESKTFTVEGLYSKEQKVSTHKTTVKDADGNEQEVYTQTVTIDGVEVPQEWNLSEEELQQYVAYMKESESNDAGDISDPVTTDDWIQGQSESRTNRKSADFFAKDYLNNNITTYNDAYKYGIESSQKFKITPIIKDSKCVGYRCTFEGDENEDES